MTAEVKSPPELVNKTGQTTKDDVLIKEEWQFPVISQQLTVSTRMLRLIERDNSPVEEQVIEVNHDPSPRGRMSKEAPVYTLDARTNPIVDRKTAEEDSREKQTTSVSARLRAYCFSNFELEVDGKRVDKWHSLKAKSLLKFLLARKKKPVSKDVLIELLWPDCSPEEG